MPWTDWTLQVRTYFWVTIWYKYHGNIVNIRNIKTYTNFMNIVFILFLPKMFNIQSTIHFIDKLAHIICESWFFLDITQKYINFFNLLVLTYKVYNVLFIIWSITWKKNLLNFLWCKTTTISRINKTVSNTKKIDQ